MRMRAGHLSFVAVAVAVAAMQRRLFVNRQNIFESSSSRDRRDLHLRFILFIHNRSGFFYLESFPEEKKLTNFCV